MMYRNKKLLALAKEAPICFGCGRTNDGTVVAAHSNGMGKGIGLKAPDLPAFLCFDCHSDCDQYKNMTKDQSQLFWFKSFYRTMLWLLETERLTTRQNN